MARDPEPEWSIRDAIPESDAAACLAIYEPFIRHTVVSFEEVVPSVEEFRQRMVATMATHPWLVLEVGGSVAGYAYGSPHRTRASYRWAADVTVYLAPSHRGVGFGRRLYAELLERLRGQRFQVACAGVTLPNEASVGLHRAMGFEPVGVYRRIGWKAGAWHDVAWFELELAPATDSKPAEPLPASGAGSRSQARARYRASGSR
jgi:L-amino acid N-acyltransferase YncA